MSTHQWQFDAPSGVYKNHKLSSKIRETAVSESKFMQFVRAEPGYGKKMGESITITRTSDITVPTSAALIENQRIPEDNLTISTQAVTVGERGRSVPFTSFAMDLAHFDLNNAVQRELMKQLRLSMDIEASDAFSAGQVKAIADGVASLTFDTDGTASSSMTVGLNMYHVEQIKDYLYGTLKCDPAVGDDYVGIVSYKAARSLKSDPAWIEWKKYTDPAAKFNGEIGRIENVRFIETNHTSAASASIGSSSAFGEGFFFGEDAVVMAVAQDPELRAKVPEDYGRSKGVAWYGVYGFAQIWQDSANAGQARVVHLTSS